MSELKPIGTVFDSQIFYPSVTTTENRASIHTWKVIAHDSCQVGYKDEYLERVTTLDVRYSKPRMGIPLVNGVLLLDWKLSVKLGHEPPPDFNTEDENTI